MAIIITHHNMRIVRLEKRVKKKMLDNIYEGNSINNQ